ncbi:hypothetical protein [Geomesophilobacter sediminis]|uniref:Uncharacterized protein n=1 Tax=Geomesophilobacter sediminis TaxID=2798584 RepID=A0A8J7M276_9BACT|nr:hypothetical protein [Geomesophilobacter sediminis]MBJ6727369.1 hypothetical protein [Geomesophilobacter sediminis]
MSKRGKQKKSENVEKRRVQMEEALECLAVKQAAEREMAFTVSRQPKQCTFRHCLQFVDPSCTVCPYCGNPLPPGPEHRAAVPVPTPALRSY